MPTVRQLFALLREDVEQEAIEETRKYKGGEFDKQMDFKALTVSNALAMSFRWMHSSKGLKYWESTYLNPPLKTQQDA